MKNNRIATTSGPALALPLLLVSAWVCLSNSSCGSRRSSPAEASYPSTATGGKSVTVVERAQPTPRDLAISTTRHLVPGVIIDEVEREREFGFGAVTWSVEGTAGGREIEIEFRERDLLAGGAPTTTAMAAK